MKTITKKILSYAVILILVAWLGYYISTNFGDFRQLTLASPWILGVLLLLALVIYVLIGYLNLVLQKPFGINMKLWESFRLSVVGGFYNFVTPFRGGAVVRAAYLKREFKMAYVHFLATLSAVNVLAFLVASGIGIIATVLIYLETGVFSWVLFVVFDILFVMLLGVVIVSPKLPIPKSKSDFSKKNLTGSQLGKEKWKSIANQWLTRFVKVINGWHLIKGNTKTIAVTSGVTFVQIMLTSLMLWLQFRVFGVEISFVAAVFLAAVSSLGLLISITPGSLGVQEAIVVFSASTIGITPAESLSAALLGRAVLMLVLFSLGPIFSYSLLKRGRTKR